MTKQNQKNSMNNRTIALMGILSAIILLMAFTPLGYLKIGTISISFLMIPVAIGAIALGPVYGAILGALFGITSFAQCFGMDAFGTFLMDVNPFFTFMVCIVARALAGYLTGLIAKAVRKLGGYGFAITGLCAALLNTVLFVGSLIAFFWHSTTFVNQMADWGMNTSTIFKFFVAFVGFNALIEAAASLFVTCGIATALRSAGLIAKAEKKVTDSDSDYMLMGDIPFSASPETDFEDNDSDENESEENKEE